MTTDDSNYHELLPAHDTSRRYASSSTFVHPHDHAWARQSSSQPQPSDFVDEDEQSWHSEVRRNFDDFVRDYFAREPPSSSVARLIQMPREGSNVSNSPEACNPARASTTMTRHSPSRNHQASLPPHECGSGYHQIRSNIYQQDKISIAEARGPAARRRPTVSVQRADISKPVRPRDEISYKVTRPYSRLNRGPTRYEVRQNNKAIRKGYNTVGANTAYRTSMRPQIYRPETHGLPRPLTTAIHTHGNGKVARQRAKCPGEDACSAVHHIPASSNLPGLQRLPSRGPARCADERQRCTCEHVSRRDSGQGQEHLIHAHLPQPAHLVDVGTSNQEYYPEDSHRHPQNFAQPSLARVKRKYVRRTRPVNGDTQSEPTKPKRRYVRRIPPVSSSEDEQESVTAAVAAPSGHGNHGDGLLQQVEGEAPPPKVKRKYVRRKGVPGAGTEPGETTIGSDQPTQDEPQMESRASSSLSVGDGNAITDADGTVRKKRKYTRRQPAASWFLQTTPNAESIDAAMGGDSPSGRDEEIRVKRKYTRRQPPGGETYHEGSSIDGVRVKRKYTRRKPLTSASDARDQVSSTTSGPSITKTPALLNFAVIPLCASRPKYPEVHSFISLHYRKVSPPQLDPSLLLGVMDKYNRNFDSALAMATTFTAALDTMATPLRPSVQLSELDPNSPPWISTAQIDTIRARQRGLDYSIDDDGMESPHSTSIVLDTERQLPRPSSHKYGKLVRWQWYLREQRKKERTGGDGWWKEALMKGKPLDEGLIHRRTSITAPLMLRRNLKRHEYLV